MAHTEALTLPLGERLAWLRWLASHAGEVPAILGAIQEITTAADWRGKWEAIKALGDVLIGILEDAPIGVQPLIEGDVQALIAVEEARFDGSLLRAILENLPALIAIITQLAGLFGKK